MVKLSKNVIESGQMGFNSNSCGKFDKELFVKKNDL